MRGRTLGELRNGPGYRERLLTHEVRVFERCFVESCADPVTAVLTLYVDAHPPGVGWYEKLLRAIPVGADTEVGLCTGHTAEVVALEDHWADHPEMWEPGRLNPPVMPGPGRAI